MNNPDRDEFLSDDLMAEVEKIFREQNRKEENAAFADWCSALESIPGDYEQRLKEGFLAETEYQPFRWMDLGLDILKGATVTGYVALMNGKRGEPLSSYLTYPVFQMGTEIFLKGMWLCQHDDCRALAQKTYMPVATRLEYEERLKKLGHDLFGIIEAVREIDKYRTDAPSMRFLKIVEGIIRHSYFPLYKADKSKGRWAHARYPKRFYDDARKEGRADVLKSYPEQQFVLRLFEEMAGRIEPLWRIRRGLMSQ